MKYNYKEEMKKDVSEYIKNEVELSDYSCRDELLEQLHNELLLCDDVTGNASGSYTIDTYRAEEYICHNLNLLAEATKEFGCEGNVLENGAEWCDVTIRCFLLYQVIEEVLNNMEEELKKAFEEAEEMEV